MRGSPQLGMCLFPAFLERHSLLCWQSPACWWQSPPMLLLSLSEEGQESNPGLWLLSPSAQRESKGSVLPSFHLPKWPGL